MKTLYYFWQTSNLPFSNCGLFGTNFLITDPRFNLTIRKGVYSYNISKIIGNTLLNGQQQNAPYLSMATCPSKAHIVLTASHKKTSKHSKSIFRVVLTKHLVFSNRHFANQALQKRIINCYLRIRWDTEYYRDLKWQF